MPKTVRRANGYKGCYGKTCTKKTYPTKQGALKGAGKIAKAMYASGYKGKGK